MMMIHISSVGLGSHIVSVFMLTWGRGPFLLVFMDAQNGFFYGFLGEKHLSFQFPRSVCKKSVAAHSQINSSGF